MPESESQLGRRALAGDRSAADALYRRYAGPLRAFVRRQMSPELRQLESSSDLVQSAFLEIWKDASALEYRGNDALRGWVFECARRKVLDHARYWLRQKRQGLLPRKVGDEHELLDTYASVCTPSDRMAAADLIAQVERAMDDLSPDQQEVIQLRGFLGLSYDEMAARLGKSAGAVRVQVHRALQSLRRSLAADGEVEDRA